jgi:hypothetical protein
MPIAQHFKPGALMTRFWAMFAGLGALLAVPTASHADFITFENKSIDRLDLAGPQVEGAFTYQATVGDGWEVITAIGNPPSSLTTFFNDQGAEVGDIVEITRTGGGFFTFQAVDFRTILGSGSDDVAVEGFSGATLVGTLNLTTSTTAFQTVGSGFAATPIDRLRVRVTFDGQNALLLDNFNLTPGDAVVPEPASAMLLGLAGLTLVGGRLWRRRVAGPAAA